MNDHPSDEEKEAPLPKEERAAETISTDPDEPAEPEGTPHTTGELDAAATREGGGPTGGLGILFIAAGLALATLLGVVAVMGYFALKP